MKILLHWVISAFAVFITAYLLPGVTITSIPVIFIVAVVLGAFNAVLRPILLILTLPITILTLGLFALVINALIVLLASRLIPGFVVEGFWWALLFAIVLSLVNSALNSVPKTKV